MAFVHTSVNETSQSYLSNEQRYNYTTPKSFLEFIRLYQSLLRRNGKELKTKMERLENGLLKLHSTAAQVSDIFSISPSCKGHRESGSDPFPENWKDHNWGSKIIHALPGALVSSETVQKVKAELSQQNGTASASGSVSSLSLMLKSPRIPLLSLSLPSPPLPFLSCPFQPNSLPSSKPKEMNGWEKWLQVIPTFFGFFCLTVLSIQESLELNFLNKFCLISCISSYIPKWLVTKRKPLLSCSYYIFILTFFQRKQVYFSRYIIFPLRTGDNSSTFSAPIHAHHCWSLDGLFLCSVYLKPASH